MRTQKAYVSTCYGHINFFPWEIIQKLFFFITDFYTLITQKKLRYRGGAKKPGGLLAHFRAIKGFFNPISMKLIVL